MIGGLLWVVLGALTDYAWYRPVFGLSYEDYNRFSLLPRLLLLASLVGFYVRQQGRSGKLGLAGFSLAVAGLTLMILGSAVEFWIGGGIRYGNKPLSHAGWAMVLAGIPTMYLGLMLFGAASFRARVLSGWRRAAPLIVVAVLPAGLLLDFALRKPLGLEGLQLSRASFGLGWMLLGYALYKAEAHASGEP